MSATQDMLEMDSIVQVSLCLIMLPYFMMVVFVVLELDIPFVFQMLSLNFSTVEMYLYVQKERELQDLAKGIEHCC